MVLDTLVTTSPNPFGVEIDGLALRATDLAWSYAVPGRPVERPAGALILALGGRDVPLR